MADLSRLWMMLANSFGRPFYRRFVRGLALKGNEWVMDFGFGPGAASRMLAEILLKEGGHLTCVDVEPSWVRLGKETLARYPNTDVQLGDISTLPVENDRYDLIILHLVLHEIDETIRDRTMTALVAKLKSGGRMVIREPYLREHGIPIDRVRAMASDRGLVESGFMDTRSLIMGPSYIVSFVKR